MCRRFMKMRAVVAGRESWRRVEIVNLVLKFSTRAADQKLDRLLISSVPLANSSTK